ncbi:hypothetical protein M1N58_02825 [Dehalococcoidales bacterium]|nr:hypothetical protein [Dehalococcoidales bacterium]
MNREERRAERKLRKRRLRWLERECKCSKAINKIVAELEENFDKDEVENAKVFFVDYLTNSGFFSQAGEKIDIESVEKIARNYDLEPADGMFILDMAEDIISAKKEGESNEQMF